jgi:cell division protein FtsW
MQVITNYFKRKGLAYDLNLLVPVMLLTGISLVMVFSSSSALAAKKFGNAYYFLNRQSIFVLAGIFALLVCRYFPYRLLRFSWSTYTIMGIAIFLLIAVHSPLGYTAGGAARWLHLGPISFQPSEFARLTMIIYLAYSLNRKHEEGKNIDHFSIGMLPHLFFLSIFGGLILIQPDFGSVVILTTVTWIVLFVGGIRIKHLVVPLIPLLPVAGYIMVMEEYRLRRWLTFLNPWENPSSDGYQIIQSLMAFGLGGFWGTGLGKGYQKLFYLPEPHTDFIFSVIGEELGLIGVLVILGAYAFILKEGFMIAARTQDRFGALIATGLTTAIGIQACIHMGVALALLPTKGITLPFLSYGGTSLVLNMACIGLLMNIGGSRS